MGPVRVHVAYCEGWDPGSRAPAGRLSPATARRRDRDGEQYAALLRTPGGTPLLLLEVARRERFLRVVLLSPDGRRVGRFRYLRKPGPDRLVLLGGRQWARPDGGTPDLLEAQERLGKEFERSFEGRCFDVRAGWRTLDLTFFGGGAPPPGGPAWRERVESLAVLDVPAFGDWTRRPPCTRTCGVR